MQIDRDHLTILNDTRIQDGHHEIWEQEYVAGIVAAEVDVRDINTVCDPPALCHLARGHCQRIFQRTGNAELMSGTDVEDPWLLHMFVLSCRSSLLIPWESQATSITRAATLELGEMLNLCLGKCCASLWAKLWRPGC